MAKILTRNCWFFLKSFFHGFLNEVSPYLAAMQKKWQIMRNIFFVALCCVFMSSQVEC